jgi:hypothetical protein
VILLLLALLLTVPQAQTHAPALTGQLSGRVIAADTGAPVRSADIRLAGVKPDLSPRIAITDDEGRFVLRDVAVGQYLLTVSKAGFVRGSFGLKKDGPSTFEVTAGQKIDFGDLALSRGGVITGRVLDAAGDPLADVNVVAWRLIYMTPASGRVMSTRSFPTNDRGEFRLYGLQPGRYFVSASLGAPGMAEAPTFYPSVTTATDALAIEVKAGQESSGVSMQLLPNPYGAVAGTVTDSKGAPYSAGFVGLIPARPDGVTLSSVQLTAIPDSTGRFKIVNVSPGDYRLEVMSRAWLEKIGQSGRIGSAGLGEVASFPVTVMSGRTEEVAVQAGPGFRVRGHVFIDGAPASGAAATAIRVAAYSTSTNISGTGVPAGAEVLPDGSFVLTGVQGPRLFRPEKPAAKTYFARTTAAGLDVTERAFEVTADVSGVEIHLTTHPARIEGTVRDAAGSAIRDANVVVFSTHRDDWLVPGGLRYHIVRSSADGAFSLASIPAGSYLAATVQAEDRDRWADPEFLESLRPAATAFTAANGSTATVSLVVKR